MSFATSPQILFDSIFSYLRARYPVAGYPEFNTFLNEYYAVLIIKINNTEPLFAIPGDTSSHNYHFNLSSASSTFRQKHYLIDSIIANEYYVLPQRLGALEGVLSTLDTMNIDSNEKNVLKSQIYLAKYSAIFWDQMPLQGQIKKGEKYIQQNESQRKAMNRDINGADVEAFCEALTGEVAVFMLTASLFTEGFSGGAALVGAAIIGTAASASRYATIKSHHWYGSKKIVILIRSYV
jgi:hypothetical protein